MNDNNKNVKKNKFKTVLIVIIIVIAIIALACGVIYLMSSNQKTPWQSGEVQILEQKVKLPMLITDFEEQFNVKLEPTDVDQIKKITLEEESETPLNLKISVYDDSVTGIIVTAYVNDSNDNTVAANDIISDRSVANRVVFPGNITIDTPLDEINNKYQTKPVNLYYKKGVEQQNSIKPRTDEYKGKYCYVRIFSTDNKIYEIEYVRADFR